MFRYIIKRVLQAILIMFFVTSISFLLIRLIPGDPIEVMAPYATEEQQYYLKVKYGLDKSVPEQLGNYLMNIVLHGDFGESYFENQSVLSVITSKGGNSIYLLINTFCLALVLSLVLGILAAIKPRGVFDNIISGLCVAAQSMPNYWLASMLILLLGAKLKIFPVMGYHGYLHTVLPSIILSLPITAIMSKTVRFTMVNGFEMDFCKAALARGIPRKRIVLKYALRDALVPLLNTLGGQIGFFIGSVCVIEYVFSYPGIGWETLLAFTRRDYSTLQGLIFVLMGIFTGLNMLIDIAASYFDPRLRKAQGGMH